MLAKAKEGYRRVVKAFAFFNRIARLQEIGLGVVGGNVHYLRVENLANFVADEIINRLHVKLGGETLLDAVDDSEFGGALFGLFEQALGLVKEASIFERNTHTAGDGAQEPHLRFAKGILAVIVF